MYFLFRYHLLQVKTKQISYPKYHLEDSCQPRIFNDRREFLDYADSVEMATEFFNLSENNEYEKANLIFIKCYSKIKELEEPKVNI